MANEKCKSYLNHVSPNNNSVLNYLSSCLVILCTLRKGWSLTPTNIYHKQTIKCKEYRGEIGRLEGQSLGCNKGI